MTSGLIALLDDITGDRECYWLWGDLLFTIYAKTSSRSGDTLNLAFKAFVVAFVPALKNPLRAIGKPHDQPL